MRTFFGYIIIFFTIPILALLLKDLYKEWQQFKPYDQFIDERISIKDVSLPEMSYITSADGMVISEITNGEKRINIPFSKMPQLLKDAFITIEDHNFFQHSGFDFFAIGRAILVNAKEDGPSQGGSTITQQLARNLYLTQEKTYNRKLSELLYSYELERYYTKEQILELYMNAIYFGNGVYGIEAASRYYFNKTTQRLTEGELLFIAAIPNNPSLYNPLKRFNATKERQERIIKQLVQHKKLTPDKGDQIIQQPIQLSKGAKIDLYPDYATYVERELYWLVAENQQLN